MHPYLLIVLVSIISAVVPLFELLARWSDAEHCDGRRGFLPGLPHLLVVGAVAQVG